MKVLRLNHATKRSTVITDLKNQHTNFVDLSYIKMTFISLLPYSPLGINLYYTPAPLLRMDPLLTLRKCLKAGTPITLHDNAGTEVSDLPQCVYIKLGNFIFSRDAASNFRSKRGAGDYYPLDAVWFMMGQRERSYGEYMQDARRNGVGVVSLVDRRDLISYLEEEQRPEECQFVDVTAPLPVPRRTFAEDEASEEVWEGAGMEVEPTGKVVPPKSINSRPAQSRSHELRTVGGKDFKNVLDIAIDLQKSLNETLSSGTNATSNKPISLIEQIASANRPTTTVKPQQSTRPTERRDIIPIIVVPATPTASITLYNARQFLEEGRYLTLTEAKSEGITKENSLFFEHKFTSQRVRVQIVDNPTRLSPADWDRVMAVFVQGNTWQFKGWKWETPVELFQSVRGFVLDFDDKEIDSKIANWNVTRITINRSRRHLDSNASFRFWAKLEEHLKSRRVLTDR